ncbi:MarR family winged helix-turn-helix transcriptional regulator [Pedobacter cryophilus]|uniref:MarR family transcriptional regulator n=1 Tax=Pedobacter cryophilus TaxID=2571271 RepID=A0A4V5NWU2_9SPHI|nr:MarR family transcriptional regulator [Pedobacter cryophilus]TKB96323.1 MarR family transcriptional regulator [Pedobacter cryophilus]
MSKYEEPLIYQLIQITKKYLGAFSDISQHIPLERYHYALLLIDEHRETLTQKALAELLQVDKSFLVTMIDYLTSNGFVYRETNLEDRRQQVIKLTSKAKKVIPDIDTSFKTLNAKAFENIPEEDVKTFFKTIELLQGNLTHKHQHEVILDYKTIKS